LNPKLQIHAYPRNQRHPRSFRFDEYYFINTNNHANNGAYSISSFQINTSIYEIIVQQIQFIRKIESL